VSLKILGGRACGRKLSVPTKPTIRPTQVLLKRRIFDSFQNLSGHSFIDLCAGSGAMGLEAWSRGAERVYLVEMNPKVFQITKRNVDQLACEQNEVSCHREDARSWLKRFASQYAQWDQLQQQNTILFLDPPYQSEGVYLDIMSKQLVGGGWFRGLIWLESDQQKGTPLVAWQQMDGLSEDRVFQQGASYLWVGRVKR
jgi:16S rRNA (guanine966-N2)-methyltransferase